MRTRILAVIFFITAINVFSTANSSQSFDAISSQFTMDWFSGSIIMNIELDLLKAGLKLPSDRYEAEHQIEQAVPFLARQYLLTVAINSYETIEDSLNKEDINTMEFEIFLSKGEKKYLNMSRDLTKLVASYQWQLSSLAALYIKHSQPTNLPYPQRAVPTQAYTGIVIYVDGKYDIRAEHGQGTIKPCLFPSIYDESMNVIMDRSTVNPEAIRKWGSVGYAKSLNTQQIEQRAGTYPLRIMARQIFGSFRTDVIISNNDALKILNSEANRSLIKQGKIVFVIGK